MMIDSDLDRRGDGWLVRYAAEYEAEEGNLHGIGLEAKYPGFKGWGYLAGWGQDGQSVDVFVDAPVAGEYVVAMRYATAGDAVRTISVAGNVALMGLFVGWLHLPLLASNLFAVLTLSVLNFVAADRFSFATNLPHANRDPTVM